MSRRPRDALFFFGDQCFVIVQDLFLTETARAGRRRPSRSWLGREDRLLHQRQPHRPPVRTRRRAPRRGAQRSRHLPHLRGRDGFHEPPTANRWSAGARPRRRSTRGRQATRGRPVDYTGLVYHKLPRPQRHPVAGQPSSIRTAPTGCTRTGLSSRPTPTRCETYGHDLLTGRHGHRDRTPGDGTGGSRVPQGCCLHAPPHEEPSPDYPLRYTDGGTPDQFHTRTKTGRARFAQPGSTRCVGRAVPADAEPLGIGEGPDRSSSSHPGGASRSAPDRRGLPAPSSPLPLRTLGPRRPRPGHRQPLADD